MKITQTDRGFRVLKHDIYANEPKPARLVQESSAIGDYEDSVDKPGSSYLWIGADHHLNREQVAELILHLQGWLVHGRLGKAAMDMHQVVVEIEDYLGGVWEGREAFEAFRDWAKEKAGEHGK